MLKKTSESTATVVSLSDLRDQVGIPTTITTFDGRLTAYRSAAIRLVEAESGKQLRSATFVETFPEFGIGKLYLSAQPLISVISVNCTIGGTTTSLSTSEYSVATPDKYQGYLVPTDTVFPTTDLIPDAVSVTYAAGYSTPPAEAVQAIALTVGEWFDFRSDDTEKNIKPIGIGVKRICDLLRNN